ncbi:hypothetical protein [Microcoleus sp.]|uniref:hypothetical protein n=1 Tax=Microcoleus sp. TaxID=44472 RepID=UPI00403E801E
MTKIQKEWLCLIALSFQLSQPVAAAVSVGKTVQTAQTNSNEAANKAFKEGVQLYQQGTTESLRGAITSLNTYL